MRWPPDFRILTVSSSEIFSGDYSVVSFQMTNIENPVSPFEAIHSLFCVVFHEYAKRTHVKFPRTDIERFSTG